MDEYFFQCPYCWERISMLIDLSQSHQNYIEDCEICCNPMQITAAIKYQNIVSFEAKSIEQ
ncbi:CPXCG motif-containing cysteine-rich protein [Winogradskyella helgolandensis]|uniref:CPXCG motif-containing cysteine-rich protein n=1 Tax=Winogradskyella helgolandensis TaxID=2697010 RepID=UPI0015B9D579|nr:CPXCG motif-containing cysteine-rich protein [Winogradskyella helgolandensis]